MFLLITHEDILQVKELKEDHLVHFDLIFRFQNSVFEILDFENSKIDHLIWKPMEFES